MPGKKNRNFKEIIQQEKRKTVLEAVMKRITGINASILYGSSFLSTFVALDILVYWLLTPDVWVWAAILIVVAVACSIFASRVTKILKKQQWRYAGR